jgi:hypothetical protein
VKLFFDGVGPRTRRAIAGEKALKTWNEIDVLERTGDKIVQPFEKELESVARVLPSFTEQPENRDLIPLVPERAEQAS